jgi:ABC-type Co2+ transport system permease subunit
MSATYEFFKDFAGPIATVVAAGAASFVAYSLGKAQTAAARMQAQVAKKNWRTANEKIVLELFAATITASHWTAISGDRWPDDLQQWAGKSNL